MRLRRTLTVLAALVAAGVAAVYAILASMDFGDLRGVIEAEAERATGRTLTIAGPLDLRISLNPAVTVEEVSLANAAWGSRPEMVRLRRLELEVALLPLISGELRVKRLVLVEPDILLETSGEGVGNWALTPASEAGAARGATRLPSFDEVLVRDGRLSVRDGGSGEAVEIRLDSLEAHAEGRSSPLAFSLAGRYDQTPVRAEGTLGSLAQLSGEASLPVRLRIEVAEAELAFEGQVAGAGALGGFDLRVAARGQNLSALGAVLGGALPPLGPYELAAQVTREDDAYRLTGISAKLGRSDLSGTAVVSLSGPRPSLRGSFTAALLDLGELSASAAPAEAAGDDGLLLPSDPLPLAPLRSFDADAKLTVGLLRLDERAALSDLELQLALADGRLAVQPFAAGLSGGRLAGQFRLEAAAKPPAFALELAVSDLDYGRLLKELAVTQGVAGTLDGNASLRGAGASLRTMAASLNGGVRIVGGEGRVDDGLLEASGAGLLDMLSRWRSQDADLRLNCVVARLPVKDGIVTAEAILVDTDAATAGATGTIDLRSETLDLRVTPQAKQASLMSLMVPFRVTGTLAEPRAAPDPLGTAVGAARIAGLFINPLAAGAAILLESSSAEQNPCVAALEEAGAGTGESAPQGQPDSALGRATRGVTDTLQGIGQGLGEGLDRLFGN